MDRNSLVLVNAVHPPDEHDAVHHARPVGLHLDVAEELPGERRAQPAAAGGRAAEVAYIGPRGWVGIRVDTKHVDWNEVGQFVKASYRAVAPKTLARAV